MIAFVVPFRSKASSNNWAYHSALVNRTISSLCNQTDSNSKVIVVYTDYPDPMISHERLTYLHFPFPFLTASEITDAGTFFKKYNYTPEYLQTEMDQARRILFGCKTAIEEGVSYIMSVDADDLVSNKIAAFVNKNEATKPAGWYVNEGYSYIEGKNIVYRYRKNLYQFCGSTNIVRADLISIPDFSNKNLLDFNFFSSHSYLKTRLLQFHNVTVEPLPFKSVMYVFNSASWSNYGNKFRGSGLKKWAKIILLGQFISKRLKKEFSLTKIDTKFFVKN